MRSNKSSNGGSHIPLSAFSDVAKNPYNEYPALLHFWNAKNLDQTVGALALPDQVGGADIWIRNFGTIVPGVSAQAENDLGDPFRSGVLSDVPSNKSMLYLTLQNASSAGNAVTRVGNPTAVGGFNLNGISGLSKLGDLASNTDVSVMTIGDAVEFHSVGFVPSTRHFCTRLQQDDTYDADNGTQVTVGVSSSIDFDQEFSFFETGVWHGTAMFQFDEMPPDEEIEIAMRWMLPYWLLGIFVIYPGWRFKS